MACVAWEPRSFLKRRGRVRFFQATSSKKRNPDQTRSHGDLHDRGDGGKALRAARQRDAPPREQAAMAATSSDGFVEKAS